DLAKRVRRSTYHGQELVARPRRLALMNLYLHNIDANIGLGDTIYDPPGRRDFDVVLTKPPFGTRGANQAPDPDDFTVSTSNKQLNFLQHVLGARTRNYYRESLVAFANWCVESGRLVGHDLARIPKADAKADPRRQRRALTEDELKRLVAVAA